MIYNNSGFGDILKSSGERCEKCHAIIADHRYAMPFSVKSKGQYRVIYIDKTTFISRRMKNSKTRILLHGIVLNILFVAAFFILGWLVH